MIILTKPPLERAVEDSAQQQSQVRDWHICEHCLLYVPLDQAVCSNCDQMLTLDAAGKIVIWRLGDIRDGVLGHLASGLKEAFGASVVIQPAYVDERPSERPNWEGISSTAFLNQVHRRHPARGVVSLGVTEHNIVPNSRYNFLFGEAYIGLPAAVVSLHAMCFDEPETDLLLERLLKIAKHEIGHSLALDHHSYEDGIDCVMVGDVALDTLELLDECSANFCKACAQSITKMLGSRSMS